MLLFPSITLEVGFMKNLICINTYKSPELVKAFVWDYIEFVRSNADYDFLVSLDGEDKETIEYCVKYSIPLLYSSENEGVGISKNRVLEAFPSYHYYFFIEDDVELLNSDVFDIHISLSKALKIEHFSLFEERRIRKRVGTIKFEKFHIIQSMYGSAQFNFFTKKGLEIVGGFHTDFAIYKRFGHTEHSYRFVNNKLSKYPFQIVEECLIGYFRWNDPVSRIKLSVEVSENELFIGEENLIAERLSYYPIKTLSSYTVINKTSMVTPNNMTIDLKSTFYKKKFYLKLTCLNLARKVKNVFKVLIK